MAKVGHHGTPATGFNVHAERVHDCEHKDRSERWFAYAHESNGGWKYLLRVERHLYMEGSGELAAAGNKLDVYTDKLSSGARMAIDCQRARLWWEVRFM